MTKHPLVRGAVALAIGAAAFALWWRTMDGPRAFAVAKGASPATPMRDIVLSVAPFIAIALGVVVLLILVPQLTLVLPRLMAAP